MFSLLRRLTLLAALSLALAACGAAPAAQPPTAAPATVAPTAAPLPTSAPAATAAADDGAASITDDLGRAVALPATPARVVSLAPSVTEILFAVGAGPQVVGATSFCNYPPEADALPEVGGFSADSFSVEAIVGLEPDLVIAGTADQLPVVEQLEQLGVPAAVLAPDSFDAVYNSITRVGALTGHAAEAERVVGAMRGRVEAVAATAAAIPAAERPVVFWEVYDDPLMTAGPNTFMGQMIELAGATNSFADAGEDYPQVSAEAVFERDPQVIFGTDSQAAKLSVEAIRQRPGWGDIRAVRDGRVYLLPDDIISRPGPRLADALETIAAALYPETVE